MALRSVVCDCRGMAQGSDSLISTFRAGLAAWLTRVDDVDHSILRGDHEEALVGELVRRAEPLGVAVVSCGGGVWTRIRGPLSGAWYGPWRFHRIGSALRTAVVLAVVELDAEHRPEWSSDEMKARGKDPIGCALCWPKDGSWPCASRMIADDLRGALACG